MRLCAISNQDAHCTRYVDRYGVFLAQEGKGDNVQAIDISVYVIDALGMNKRECKKLETTVSPKFAEIARRFSVPAAWLAELACDLFANDPPVEIVVVSDGKLSR